MATPGLRYSIWVNSIQLPAQFTSDQRYAWWCEFISRRSFLNIPQDSDSESEPDDMADRFPSIEDIEGGDSEVRTDQTGGGDFLERERAALGEDADLFSANDAPKQTATVEDGDDDLLGGDDFSAPQQSSANNNNDLGDFESSFPAIDSQNENVGPGGSITNTSGGYTNYNPPQTEADSEPIRAWREKRDADIARRDEASRKKKEETIATAQKDIDSFYENYNRKIDRQKTQVAKEAEEFLAKREDTTAGGTSWERISKLVDLSGKGQSGGGEGSSKKRMREMLISLKNDKDAPAATVA